MYIHWCQVWITTKTDTEKPITLERKVLRRFYDLTIFIEQYEIRHNEDLKSTVAFEKS